MSLRFFLVLGLVGFGFAESMAFPNPPYAPTLRLELARAEVVLYGTSGKPMQVNNVDEWITPVSIEKYVKKHAAMPKGKTSFLDWPLDEGRNYIVFFDKKMKPYRAEQSSPAAMRYLEKLDGLKCKNEQDFLSFFFQYVTCEDWYIAADVFTEFERAESKDLAALTNSLPVNQLVDGLEALFARDRKEFTGWCGGFPYLGDRARLFATLLGLSGQKKHAPLLRRMLKDERFYSPEALIAFMHLAPQEAWSILVNWADPMNKANGFEFQGHVALQATALMRDKVPYLWSKAKRDQLTPLFLAQDLTECWVEELRKGQAWDLTDKVLSWWDARPGPQECVKESILRFALRNPDVNARDFIRRQRLRDSEWVHYVEELLDLEDPPKK